MNTITVTEHQGRVLEEALGNLFINVSLDNYIQFLDQSTEAFVMRLIEETSPYNKEDLAHFFFINSLLRQSLIKFDELRRLKCSTMN